MENNLWQHLLQLRKKSPLILSITNYVVMNNTANALLAIGIIALAKADKINSKGVNSTVQSKFKKWI